METAGWIVVVAIVVVLFVVAVIVLFADSLSGAIGGRKTLERARRLLIFSVDAVTEEAGRDWIRNHIASHPDVICVTARSSEPSGYVVFQDVQREIEQHHPDAVVWMLPDSERHAHESPYATAKRELTVPMDAVWIPAVAEEKRA